MNRRTPAEAESAFWARINELGARPAEDARYINKKTPVPLLCARGHACAPRPAAVAEGHGICRRCAFHDPAAEDAFWARVKELGGRPQTGAEYVNGKTPVPLWCEAGHDCRPKPTSLQSGQGLCQRCADPAFRAARQAFWTRVAALEAQPAAGAAYIDRDTPVSLVCRAGHSCMPTPTQVLEQYRICQVCGVDPELAEDAFQASLAAVGAHLAPGAKFVAAQTRVALICRNGHPCAARPADIRPGRRFCRTCAQTEKLDTQAAFWARVTELGGRPTTGSTFRDMSTPVTLWCKRGHECSPTPANVLQRGTGLCQTCAGNSPQAAAEAFWATVAALGAKPQEGARYTTRNTPVPLVCRRGHSCAPTPANLRAGQGCCRLCANGEAPVT